MSQPSRPLPVATEVTRPFWEAAREHRLLIQCCADCGRTQFYPRPFCRHCLSDALHWKPCSGRGRVYTFTINHRAANAYMADKVPYAVAIVELDEGVKLMANIVQTPLDAIRIGARVAIRWLDIDGQTSIPQFALEQDA